MVNLCVLILSLEGQPFFVPIFVKCTLTWLSIWLLISRLDFNATKPEPEDDSKLDAQPAIHAPSVTVAIEVNVSYMGNTDLNFGKACNGNVLAILKL